MEILRWKARIALLWVFMAVAMSAHSLGIAFERGGLEEAIAEMEAMGPLAFILTALFWLIPLWLAFLAMTLKDSCNRWVNLVLGIVITLLNIYHLTWPCVGSDVYQWLIIGSTVVATGLIAWYAWKWPKQEA